MKVCAGIVLYNPDIDRLKENIDAIYNQVDEVILIDNASSNISNINLLVDMYRKVLLVKNDKNLGIAEACNQILTIAQKNKCEWALMLDQDSVAQKDLISQYLKFCFVKDVAIITCNINDRNFKENDEDDENEYKEVEKCISSGSFVNVTIAQRIGAYDSKMFIDRVDTDFCYRIIENNYKILRINYDGLLHEVGNKTYIKKIFGKDVYVFNHSPFRSYYIIRNGVYFFRKHYKYIDNKLQFYLSIYRRILVFVFFENYKLKKLIASIKGLIVGHFMKVNKIKIIDKGE